MSSNIAFFYRRGVESAEYRREINKSKLKSTSVRVKFDDGPVRGIGFVENLYLSCFIAPLGAKHRHYTITENAELITGLHSDWTK
jgi:hypothetical protein